MRYSDKYPNVAKALGMNNDDFDKQMTEAAKKTTGKKDNSLYTISVTHPDGTDFNNGVHDKEIIDRYLRLFKLKYPDSESTVKEIFGVITCWMCGDPIIITDRNAAEDLHQRDDKLCCSDKCRHDKKEHYK